MMNNEEEEHNIKLAETPKVEPIQSTAPVKVKKENKPKKTEKIKQETPVEPKDPLIDIDEISKKSRDLKNSEILLFIFEIATNSAAYGLTHSNKSRLYWDKLKDQPQFSKILDIFKTETLRKYWRLLSEISSIQTTIELIKKKREIINQTSLKPLTIISFLKDYSLGKIKNFDSCLLDAPDRAVSSGKYARRKDWEEESMDEETQKALNTKRRKAMKEDSANGDDIENRDEEMNNCNGKKSGRAKQTTNLFTEEDKRLFSEIDSVIEAIKSQVPEISDQEIWDALRKNSFNIVKTYEYLIDSENKESKHLI